MSVIVAVRRVGHHKFPLNDFYTTPFQQARSLLPRSRPGEVSHARAAPHHLTVLLSLAGLVSRDPARLEEADALYREAISVRADYTQAYINRGDVLIRLNRTREAQRHLRDGALL